MTDMLDVAFPPMLQTCSVGCVPGKPHLARLLESEFLLKLPSVCQSVINLFWISSLLTVYLSIPLGEEDRFYVTASWSAQGLGPVCLVVTSVYVCLCVCMLPMLQRSNVAKARINTLWGPWRGTACQVVYVSLCIHRHTQSGVLWPSCRKGCIESMYLKLPLLPLVLLLFLPHSSSVFSPLLSSRLTFLDLCNTQPSSYRCGSADASGTLLPLTVCCFNDIKGNGAWYT